MNQEEIKQKIIEILNRSDYQAGILNKELMILLKIKQKTSESLMYNDALNYLEFKKPTIRRQRRKVKGKTLIYLIEYEDIAIKKWNIKNKELLVKARFIESGYLFIHQGFFTKKEGTLLDFKGYASAEELVHSDLLDKFSDVEDDSDFLFFWVNNRNALLIDNVIAKMYVVPSYFKPLTSKKKVTFKCDYEIDYGNIEITCHELFPNRRAYALIPIKRLNERVELAEDVPELKVWYDNYPIDHVKGGEVTTNLSGGTRIILE